MLKTRFGKMRAMIKTFFRDDSRFSHADVPLSSDTYHVGRLIEYGNHANKRVLEIGSREVTGQSQAHTRFAKADYTGFDYYPGPNVDVVGDVHRLTQYFNEPFDVIYSYAVFEHLAMPWVAALEIAKCLKVGGMVCVVSHFSFSSHERPWHFYQFSDLGLKSLFSPALGFECLESGMSNPIVGRFSTNVQDGYLANQLVRGLYCHSTYLGKKTREVSDGFDWNNVDVRDVVGETKYPQPNK